MAKRKDDTELMAAIGRALNAWSLVELQLGTLFNHVSGVRDDRKSRAIFDGIVSFDVRKGIVDRLMALEDTDDLENEMWRRMSESLTKAYSARHTLAHFSVVSEKGDSFVSPFLTWEKFHKDEHARLTVKDIKARQADFEEHLHGVNWFMFRAVARRIKDKTDLYVPEEPAIVPILRDRAKQALASRAKKDAASKR